jgi:hypothetical protein
MSRRDKAGKRGVLTLVLLVGGMLLTVASMACSNANVSVGGSIHRSSGGNWGHSISVGVHSNGRRW